MHLIAKDILLIRLLFSMTVGRLLTIVAEPLGIEQEAIDTLNLDQIVEHETKKQAQEPERGLESDRLLARVPTGQKLVEEEKKYSLERIDEATEESEHSWVEDLADEPLTGAEPRRMSNGDYQNRQLTSSRNSYPFPFIDSSRSASAISDF